MRENIRRTPVQPVKKILFYCHSFYPQTGGYANAFRNLIDAILDHQLDMFITVMTPEPLAETIAEIKRERLEIIRLKQKTTIRKICYFVNEYSYAKTVSKKFKSEAFDILFIETFEPAFFISSLDRDILDRTAVRIHSTTETEITFFARRTDFLIRKYLIKLFVAKKIKWIISTNSYHIAFAKKYFYNENLIEIGNKAFFTLPNPVNTTTEPPRLPSQRLRLISLGRMDNLGNNQKGFTDLIYALRLLTKSTHENLEIKIIGKGELRNSLMKLCSHLTNITFIEELTHQEIMSLLQNADVVVLPSRYEGLSMFALEGLATGNVCVFAKTGGLLDMVEDNGILFEPQDVESLANALTSISRLTHNDVLEMKEASIRLHARRFTPEIVSKKFREIYELIVSS